ncbi:unnamed protein product, partial [Rotaria socialis]
MKRNDPIRHDTSMQRSMFKRNSGYSPESQSTFTSNKQIQMNLSQKPFYTKYSNDQSTFQHQFNNCKICGRQNHRTIDCFRKRTTGCFNCGQNHIIHVNNQPTETIVDTGSAISIIRLDFLKTVQHTNFIYRSRICHTANSTPLNIIGQVKLEVKIKFITTYVTAYVATNLITSILLGNDWINSNHVHLFGDQKQLTIPDQHGQLISIPYVEPSGINYPALLVHQITLPSHSQTLVDITCQVNNDHNIIFEPYARHISKFIFIPHTLLNINNNQAKVLLINAQNRQQTLSKNTRIGTISRDATYTIYATTQVPTTHHINSNEHYRSLSRNFKPQTTKAILHKKDNAENEQLNTICDNCNEHFLSGNDLQKHLRAEFYSDQIRKQILDSTKHIENPKHQLAIQDILWRNKILFDPTPSTINIPPQSAIKTRDHPPIYSKQYPASYKDQDIKFQETQKLLERGQIEESTSPWSSPIVLVKKKDKTMRFCIDYRRLNAITIKDAFPLPRINEIFDQLSDAVYYTKFDFKSGYFQVPLSNEDRPKTAFSTRDNHYQFTVLPQGITNGPATFQRVINHILGPARWQYALAYIDDIIIYSKTFEEHLSHLNDICTILKNARFRLNPDKCEIARTQTYYLGHNIKHGEIRPSPTNINGLLNTRLPQTPDEACKFVKAA